MSGRWYNRLPDWIVADMQERPLRQGPHQTLQVIAGFCDAPPSDPETSALLVCFGGNKLHQTTGCARSTFWAHLRLLTDRGYVVPLWINNGRLANVYGIPGQPGELNPFRAQRGNPVRRWEPEDTPKIRVLLSENRALAELADRIDSDASDSRAQRASVADRKRPDSGGVASDDRALPSVLSSSCTSAHRPSDHAGNRAPLNDDDVLPGSASPDHMKRALQEAGIDVGRAHNFAFHPLITPAMIQEVLALVDGRAIRNPGGYVGNLMDDAINRAREVDRDRQRQVAAAECAARAEADEHLDHLPDNELIQLVADHRTLRELSPATIRNDRAFRPETVRLLAARRNAISEKESGQ